MSLVRVAENELLSFASEILQKTGLADPAVDIVSQSLVDADRHGVSSHGLIRLPIYVARLQQGMVDPNAVPDVTVSGARASVDGNNAMGALVASTSLDAACSLAEQYGIASSCARHSNHCGTLSFYARRAAERGYFVAAMSNAPVTMAYHGGRTRAVGTNPFAIAIPRVDGPPIVHDIASSTVARGKIIVADSENKEIPPGWGIDTAGRPTTVASEALEGAVLPFAGPKGSGLALMIELLCGVFAGAASGQDIGDMYQDWSRPQNVGHTFLAVQFSDLLKRHGQGLETFLEQFGALPPAEGFDGVRLPGELEQEAATTADEHGVPLSESTAKSLAELARQLNLATPTTLTH